MLSVTAYHSTTRRLASGVGKVSLDHTRRPFSARHPRIAEHKSLFKKRHWLGDTLCTLSTAMGLIRLLDNERELLVSKKPMGLLRRQFWKTSGRDSSFHI